MEQTAAGRTGESEALPVLDAIVRTAARLCEARDALIYRVDGRELRLVARYGPLRAVGDTIPLARDWVGGRAVLDRKTLHVRDVTRATGFPGSRAGASRTKVRTLLATPLLRGGAAVGVILIRRTLVRPFTAKQLTLLKTFADQAVIAIENVRLFTELRSRNVELRTALEQQTATADILRVISRSPTDAEPVFQTIVDSAARLLRGNSGVLSRIVGDQIELAAFTRTDDVGDALLASLFPISLRSSGSEVRPIRDRVIGEHIPYNVADVETDPRVGERGRANARARGYRSQLVVPMLRHDEPLGTIAVTRSEPGSFSDEEVALLTTFADQAVIAIENVRLFTELQSSNHELRASLEQQTATSELLKVIGWSTFDLQPVFETLAENAVRLCDGHQAFIFRFDGQVLRVVASHNASPELRAFFERNPTAPERGSVAGRAAIERRTIHLHDIRDDAGRTWGAHDVDPIRTVLTIPMLRAGEVLGVIGVNRLEVRPFSDNQVALLETFADQAAIAIENARLLGELQAKNSDLTEALEQQTATSEILRVISSSPTDLQPVFDSIAASATRLCDALFGLVFRLESGLITLVAHDGATPEQLSAIRGVYPMAPGGQTVAARAIHERRVIAIADSQTSGEYPHIAERARAIGYRSLVSVPMLRGGVALGAINVVRAAVLPFTDTQIELLKTFADQAVIAIENVRLFSELEARNRDLTESLQQQTSTAEILRVISGSPTDVQPVFDAIVAAGQRLIGGFSCALRLLEGEQLRLAAFTSTGAGGDESIRSIAVVPVRSTGLMAQVLGARMATFIADIETDPLFTPRERELARARGYRSLLSAPLLREGSVIGVINVTRTGAGPFSPSEIALLQTFADQAVIAIENVRLVSELQGRTEQLARSVDELTALGEVSRALSSTLDLESVLNTIVSRASQLAGTSACSVYEYDEVTEEFRWRASANLDEEVAAVARRTPIGKGASAQARMVTTREPVQIADIRAEETYGSPLRDVLLRTGVRAVLAVPLLRDDRLVGGLTVNRKTPGAFPPEVVELLKTFAAQSALAINNARLFREIEEKSRQLEIASQHKSQFLANMSHELRTPLNAILGYTELIVDNIYGEVPERMREVLERVDKSGRHLLGLINDILDLSKIEAGQLTLALGPYSMDGVAQTVATQVGALAAEKRLDFELVLGEDLPIGQGDERRLIQVLLNLVGNAIKFTDAGKIVVRVEAADGDYVVSVTDTGPGIAEADREKIFEEFQQADTTRAKAKGGTGLGLAISRRIVAMHGGRLWVESTLGEGSTFSFTVPVHVDRQVTLPRPGAQG
jgi:GAF domain-containing protein